MKTPLKPVGFAVVTAILLCSCAAFQEFRRSRPRVPIVKDKPYPSGIGHYGGGGGMAVMCLRGDYTGEHIDEALEKGKAYSSKNEPVRSDLGGKGKIHTRYIRDWDYFPPPIGMEKYRDMGTKEEWGYTFTVHTTDDGIITRCSATQQLLRRW
jgi:hypothetical protein